MNVLQFIQLDDHSVTPKYLQLANSIVLAGEKKLVQENEVLPSINELSYALDISRDTAEKAYRHLKNLGLINSVPGKGFFITHAGLQPPNRVFLLFNKLSAHKKIIYDVFMETLGNKAFIDFYIYNNDFGTFKKIIQNRKEGYTHYVIITHFMDADQDAAPLLNEIKDGKLILLDKLVAGITRPYAAVYEDFSADIFNALTAALPQISRYHTLKLIFPSYTYFPVDIIEGFQAFCRQYAFSHAVVHSIGEEKINAGEVFINLMEDDLLTLLGKIKATSLTVGKDIGIISYNETPWKEHILDGVTTISTDFTVMGQTAAHFVLNDAEEKIKLPFRLTLRASL